MPPTRQFKDARIAGVARIAKQRRAFEHPDAERWAGDHRRVRDLLSPLEVGEPGGLPVRPPVGQRLGCGTGENAPRKAFNPWMVYGSLM